MVCTFILYCIPINLYLINYKRENNLVTFNPNNLINFIINIYFKFFKSSEIIYLNSSYKLNSCKIGNLTPNFRELSNISDNSSKSEGGTKSLKELTNEEFIEWLRGFTDGEGCFMLNINNYKNKEGVVTSKGITLKYTIFLHKDDAPMLKQIKNRLGLGTVRIYERFVSFEVTKQKEIEKIIEIFSQNPLNTSKHLNFLEFKKAYSLYINMLDRNNSPNDYKSNRLKIFEEILLIKSSMNRKRTSFEMPSEHTIKITPYWLLGFIEGEGSFSIAKNNYFSLEFGISQTLSEKKVMLEIQRFLLSLPGNYSVRSKFSNVVPLNEDKKAKNERSNPIVKIQVTDSNYISNVIIPFFDSLIWLSKKELDYLDWKVVLNLKIQGKHFLPEGNDIIVSICNRMNLNRLSTNINSEGDLEGNKIVSSAVSSIIKDLDLKIKLLLEAPSNLEVHSDGKIYINSLGKYLRGRGNVKVEVFKEGLLFRIFDSIVDCSKHFKVDTRTINRRLDSGDTLKYNNEFYILKRKV